MPSTNGHGSKPERVALYLRVSSEEQREAGTIQTQHEFLERLAAERGFEIVEVYADEGVSGKFHLHERPEGLRLLEEARTGKFDTVLVYKLDRLARSQLGILDAADRLERLGVALRSATEHYETATPQGGSCSRCSALLPSSSARLSSSARATGSTGSTGRGATWGLSPSDTLPTRRGAWS